ncbi:MAG: hypothetical protein HQ446_14870 [Polaromonas sp.]|nr:hypothetical protein [Polaromonas sp.]
MGLLIFAACRAVAATRLPLALALRAYLESLGVKSATAVAQGKCDPVNRDCSTTASRAQQIVCLQSDRRVTIEVTGVATWAIFLLLKL